MDANGTGCGGEGCGCGEHVDNVFPHKSRASTLINVLYAVAWLTVAAAVGAGVAWWQGVPIRPAPVAAVPLAPPATVGTPLPAVTVDKEPAPADLVGAWAILRAFDPILAEPRVAWSSADAGFIYYLVPPRSKKLLVPFILRCPQTAETTADKIKMLHDVIDWVDVKNKENGLRIYDISYKSGVRRVWEMLSVTEVENSQLPKGILGDSLARGNEFSNLVTVQVFSGVKRTMFAAFRRVPLDRLDSNTVDPDYLGRAAWRISESVDRIHVWLSE